MKADVLLPTDEIDLCCIYDALTHTGRCTPARRELRERIGTQLERIWEQQRSRGTWAPGLN